jgi:hypothetical protein
MWPAQRFLTRNRPSYVFVRCIALSGLLIAMTAGSPPSAISNPNTVSSQPFSPTRYKIGYTGSEARRSAEGEELSRDRTIDLLAWSAAIMMIASMLLILVGRIHL